MIKRIAFLPATFADFNQWATENKGIYVRVVKLIKEIERDPFVGIGKPEPLKHDLAGLWSRRITDEHRLVYKVTEEEVIIVSCKFHY